MPTILGIDAAWTISNPSGVALVQFSHGIWRCLRVTPNAKAFVEAAFGQQKWPPVYTMTALVSSVLKAADTLAGEPVSVVALDLPLSRHPITGRRQADEAISKLCGRFRCPTHSPSATRPGPLSEAYRDALTDQGFSLCTNQDVERPARCAIEVYPHPAIVALLGAHERLPYKVGKTTRYWNGASRNVRWRLLIGVLGQILVGLQQQMRGIQIEIPDITVPGKFSSLKPIEDMIDALVCAWVGMQHIMGRTRSLGDDDAAIWLPECVQFFPPPHNQDDPQ